MSPTPTQMFDGIQFQRLLGETTTTSCARPSFRRKISAAVCPDTPAPRTTTLAMSVRARALHFGFAAGAAGYHAARHDAHDD